ncbi:MAG: DUF2490 domain-containing protein [Methylococcaceae bacterium]|jgi:hypothetical protein
MNKIKNALVLSALLLAKTIPSFAVDQGTGNFFGVWGSVTLQGDFKSLSPGLDKFKWQIMNQSRTRDDSPQGSRFTENLLFSQVGYQLNDNASLALGYVHDWIHPLDKTAYQESRPYQDFVWNQNIGDFKLLSRTRMEERINQTTGNTGYRPRQLLQISHPLPFMEGLSAYVGDEVFFYLNQNKFGKQGFSENRVLAGLSYQFTPQFGTDLGYLGQYVDNISGNNLFTHNLQANLRYKF